jgi:hypothetical protein
LTQVYNCAHHEGHLPKERENEEDEKGEYGEQLHPLQQLNSLHLYGLLTKPMKASSTNSFIKVLVLLTRQVLRIFFFMNILLKFCNLATLDPKRKD